MAGETSGRTPWHVWVIGVVALLWSGMGALDYVMTQTKNEDYLSAFTPEQVAYFTGFPAWFDAAWALAVWGGVLGALLLLMRTRLSVPVLALSFIAMVVTSVHTFAFTDWQAMMGTGGAIFSALIFLFALFMVVYARTVTPPRAA
ncbi:MAG: hypothetical protein ACFB6R_03320 [Alphaproteobacteria bacterium]